MRHNKRIFFEPEAHTVFSLCDAYLFVSVIYKYLRNHAVDGIGASLVVSERQR